MIATYQRHKTTQVASWDGRLYKLSQASSQEEKSTAIPEIIIYVLSNLFVSEEDIHNYRVLLMENQETVNNIAWYGWTALHYAVQRGEAAVCHALLGRGADVHAIDVGLESRWLIALFVSLPRSLTIYPPPYTHTHTT